MASMPDDLETMINRAAASMPSVQWASAAQIRDAARSYRRRRAAIVALAAVVGLGGGAGIVTTGLDRPTAAHRSAQVAPCPDGLVRANIALPDVDQIRVSILSGSSRADAAAGVAQDLRLRDFSVIEVRTVPGDYDNVVAIIRYGPRTVGAAWVMRSYFLDQAQTEFSLNRDDDVVDVVIGTRFQSLATRTEVNQSIAVLGRAEAPPGTCAE
jgi:hypothetical protein